MTREVSKRGVYYNLEMSPYKYVYKGETFKFSSLTKLTSYLRKVKTKLNDINKNDFENLANNNLYEQLVDNVYKTTYNEMKK